MGRIGGAALHGLDEHGSFLEGFAGKRPNPRADHLRVGERGLRIDRVGHRERGFEPIERLSRERAHHDRVERGREVGRDRARWLDDGARSFGRLPVALGGEQSPRVSASHSTTAAA